MISELDLINRIADIQKVQAEKLNRLYSLRLAEMQALETALVELMEIKRKVTELENRED